MFSQSNNFGVPVSSKDWLNFRVVTGFVSMVGHAHQLQWEWAPEFGAMFFSAWKVSTPQDSARSERQAANNWKVSKDGRSRCGRFMAQGIHSIEWGKVGAAGNIDGVSWLVAWVWVCGGETLEIFPRIKLEDLRLDPQVSPTIGSHLIW